MLYERERCIDFCVIQRYMLVTDGKSGPPLAALFPQTQRLTAAIPQFHFLKTENKRRALLCRKIICPFLAP